AVTSTYLQTMLPYVAGLGPRKAHALVNAINTKLEGTLINRTLLLSRSILPFQVFQNCASFLRIEQDMLLEADEDDVPDVLDSTRIHPEDYDFPRKMAADALNKHEEDLEGEHPSLPCKELMEDADPADKLSTLDLDNYAQMLYERKGEKKRATLLLCKQELIKPYDDLRKQRLENFMAGFGVISSKLKEMYQTITLGGNAELELVDSLDPFAEGILFSVMPPKKSWKNISNLSGGEKTLSSLALVFALHAYKPTPVYVMDEIDAALDFRNVSIVANLIRERTKGGQFIIISLRNNMF
ncbi:hypothetical protein Golomagni_07802, partial [Golovinomyces magnicellulatus]